MTTPVYEAFAIRYATRDARRTENFIGGDPHDAPMPLELPSVSLVLPCASVAELSQLPLPALLLSLYGVFDLSRRPTASRSRYKKGWILSERLIETFAVHFGAEATSNVKHALYSPLFADPALLRRLPCTLIVAAEHDILHDDSVDFAARA